MVIKRAKNIQVDFKLPPTWKKDYEPSAKNMKGGLKGSVT